MTSRFLTPKNANIALTILLLIGLVPATTAFSKTRKTQAKAKQSARSEKTVRGSKAAKTRETAQGKRGKALSRRERAQEEARIRRERQEAARRAEIAREQAIARQRAADQTLRNESIANIAKDNTVGEDLEVRRVAIQALGNHAGSVVVMDPKTGRVLTVVNQEWALRRGFKPCSTIKLVTGLAGLSEKVIDPAQQGTIKSALYAQDLADSLAFSNNGYFQHVGGDVGFEKMITYARELGLGQKTGINEPNEFSGALPISKTGGAVNHMSSHGDDFEVTPIQLGVLVSAIANGGTLLVPHLPRTVEENQNFKPEVRRGLNIPKDALQHMIPGMIGAVNYGTARLAYDPTETVAGKTGTCIGQGSWLGLFTSYAPVANPQLAVVVVTRGSGERGKVAAGIAGNIYRGLDSRYGRTLTPQQIANTPKVPAADSQAVNGEDEEEGDSMDGNAATAAPKTVNSVVKTDTVKRVIMTIPSRPLVNRTPVLKESAPDDIRIIDESKPQGTTAAPAPSQADQRPRRSTNP